MTSPHLSLSDSGEIFFSSSPRHSHPSGSSSHGHSRNLSDEVLLLVAKAQLITTLTSATSSFLVNPSQRTLFRNVFTRKIELLKSRSQAFEDGHVTVYDKTLLALTRNGNDLDCPAGIEYFCEEFLGINRRGEPMVAHRILQQEVTLPALLIQEVSPLPSMRSSAPWSRQEMEEKPQLPAPSPETSVRVEQSIERPHDHFRLRYRSTSTKAAQALPVSTPSSYSESPEMEAKLTQLWSVYSAAKAEYFAISRPQSQSKPAAISKAARFLRDTAENTLQYLRNKNVEPIMLAELEGTYNMAKSMAVSLTGGKKRKFDVTEMEWVGGVPKGPSGLRQSRVQEFHGNGKSDVCGSGKGGCISHGYDRRSLGYRTRAGESPERHGNAGYGSGAVGTTRTAPASPRHRISRVGGHGGNPYGTSTSRDVDSYIPKNRY